MENTLQVFLKTPRCQFSIRKPQEDLMKTKDVFYIILDNEIPGCGKYNISIEDKKLKGTYKLS
jgi:hypothetical protein